ncbi:hypothetical protein FIBSPDRAFT_932842 [Athelia psychrophila]|uniref:Uncharacterized protein n=1 Tax=Athelia psychrophila TaxID=1759441 RepID=A0A166I877_9AGAM|nr:hypothetical protein FIBSPDRAFT_932842 [Fibularhizoctonia sp. CBS 109695]
MISWTIITSTLGFLLAVKSVQSQTPLCLPEFSWMDNSLGQSPCLMTTLALDILASTPWVVLRQAQAAGFMYAAPTKESANACECSSVTYSLWQACGMCQNGSYDGWSDYKSNCIAAGVTISFLTFPEPIPAGTAFPAWAYLNVTNDFNIAAAQAAIAGPESMAPIPTSTSTVFVSASTSTSTLFIPSSTNSTPTNSPSTTSNPSSVTRKSSNTGAIAGGVIGGVVFVTALAGLTVYLLRRRKRSHAAPSDVYYGGESQMSPPPMSDRTSFAQQQQPLYRPYDPSDPGTFPESPPTPTIQTTNSGFRLAAQEQPGVYRGLAEL